MVKKALFLSFLLITSKLSIAQDLAFARKMTDTLTSSYFWGRGYTNDGMSKAGRFIAAQFQAYGLKPINDNSFTQDFSYSANTFPAEMDVSIDGKKLIPGRDFIVAPESNGGKGIAKLVRKESTHFLDTVNKVALIIQDKLTWSVAPRADNFIIIVADKKVLPPSPSKIEFNISNTVIPNFKASNICGIVKGTKYPDSVLIVSGHYDHLGGMGKDTYFPGANDNASGISLLLGLAKYYAANPQPYSMVFLCFAGEEAGLIGSKYFTQHPLLPLEKIRFLINIDMVGTGDEGITVVNGLQYPKEYSILTQLNNTNHYLLKVNARGKAANSDHYWFTEKGVPAFFIYTLGGIKAYHDVFDLSKTLPLNEYEDLFHLITKFNSKLME
jgi:aminopeptidase YwaD